MPALMLYAWLRWCNDTPHPIASLGQMVAAVLPAIVVILAHTWLRFHTLSEQGYPGEGFTGHIAQGLYGLLLSPGKSIFLYAPLMLALPLAAPPFARRFPPEAYLVAALSAIILLESAAWWMWWGGWGWGPRFLVPLMPFWVLALGTLTTRRRGAALIALLLPLALAVNLPGILVDFNAYLRDLSAGHPQGEALALYHPAYAPLLAHVRRFDPAAIPIVSLRLGSPHVGFHPTAAPLISLSVVLLILVALRRLWRAARRADSATVTRL